MSELSIGPLELVLVLAVLYVTRWQIVWIFLWSVSPYYLRATIRKLSNGAVQNIPGQVTLGPVAELLNAELLPAGGPRELNLRPEHTVDEAIEELRACVSHIRSI